MSRRKQNPLLKRILLVSLAAHIVALPVLARFGVFERVKQQLQTRVINVESLPPEKLKDIPKAGPKKAAATAKKAGGQANKGAKSNLNQPKVVASNAPEGAGGGEGSTVNAEGNGKAGSVPTEANKGGGAEGSPKAEPKSEPKAKEEPKVEPAKPIQPPKEVPKAEPKKETPKPAPILVSAEPIEQPLPEIPEDLRAEAFDKTTVVLIDVLPSGTAGKVEISQSSGVDELDAIALKAARKWKFKPATRDGEAVPGKVRLHVHFKVD